jgi:hypothetical protein
LQRPAASAPGHTAPAAQAGIAAGEVPAHLTETPTGRSETLHQGFLQLVRDEVRLPDGRLATREYIRHSGAVAVIALLDDAPDPRLVLVRQHRHPVGEILLELPAGRLEPALERGHHQPVLRLRPERRELGGTAGARERRAGRRRRLVRSDAQPRMLHC